MAIKFKTAVITKKKTIAQDTYWIKLEPQDAEVIEFDPGQFVTLIVAPNIRRSYSIASLPGNKDFGLIGDTVAGGPGSKFFLNSKVGDKVEYIGPIGRFTYKESSNPAYFLATGTGLVPFMSMIKHALTKNKSKGVMKLFVGFRHQEQVFSKEYFEKLDKEFSNFEFILTLTKPDKDWKGLTGRITKYYEKELENADIDAYICGSKKMVEDVEKRLIKAGVKKESILYEPYY